MPRPAAYKVAGKKVVGTTTPINAFDAGGKTNNLLDWAQRLATEYEYYDGVLWHSPKHWRTTRDGRGDVGTYTHADFLKWLDPEQPEPDKEGFDEEQLKEAYEKSNLLKEWTRKNPINAIAVEEPMVSVKHRYGGTPDVIDAKPKIIDVKTGFVNEFSCMLQCSAYDNLALENGLTTEHSQGIILQPYNGYVKVYSFSAHTLEKYFPVFLGLLKAYNAEKEFAYMRKKK